MNKNILHILGFIAILVLFFSDSYVALLFLRTLSILRRSMMTVQNGLVTKQRAIQSMNWYACKLDWKDFIIAVQPRQPNTKLHSDVASMKLTLRFFFLWNRETNLYKEHELAVSHLSDWKRKFQARIIEIQRQVLDFRFKDRVTEAEAYVAQLEEMKKKLEEFNIEVGLGVLYTSLATKEEHSRHSMPVHLSLK